MTNPYEKYKGYTEGPWTDDICTFGPDGKPIMVCTEESYRHGDGTTEDRANAILIAAAPLLLNDCRDMYDLLIRLNWTVWNAGEDELSREIKELTNRIEARHKEITNE